jgi:hypothetical protein
MEASDQLHDPAALPSGKELRVGPTAGLDAVVRSKIPSPYRDSNPRSSSSSNAIPTELSRLTQHV